MRVTKLYASLSYTRNNVTIYAHYYNTPIKRDIYIKILFSDGRGVSLPARANVAVLCSLYLR